jgi:hypothetical protein
MVPTEDGREGMPPFGLAAHALERAADLADEVIE